MKNLILIATVVALLVGCATTQSKKSNTQINEPLISSSKFGDTNAAELKKRKLVWTSQTLLDTN